MFEIFATFCLAWLGITSFHSILTYNIFLIFYIFILCLHVYSGIFNAFYLLLHILVFLSYCINFDLKISLMYFFLTLTINLFKRN